MKKFELTAETKIIFGKTLYRIRALISFKYANAGDLGGWIEKEENLDQKGDAWVSGDARVYGDAHYFNFVPFYGLTFFRTKARKICAAYRGKLYETFEGLLEYISANGSDKVKIVELAIEIAKEHIDLTPAEGDESEIKDGVAGE